MDYHIRVLPVSIRRRASAVAVVDFLSQAVIALRFSNVTGTGANVVQCKVDLLLAAEVPAGVLDILGGESANKTLASFCRLSVCVAAIASPGHAAAIARALLDGVLWSNRLSRRQGHGEGSREGEEAGRELHCDREE